MPVKTQNREYSDLVNVKRTLASTMQMKNITVASLAKKLKTDRTAVRRTLDTKYGSTTIKTLERTANALGLSIKLEARPLTPDELGALAQRMIDAPSPKEGDRLEQELIKGFYGAESPA